MTAIGNVPSVLIRATSAKAGTASNCSLLPLGTNEPQTLRSIAAPPEPSSGTAHTAAGHVVGLASTSTRPMTSSAYCAANVTASAPPKEWPTTTYGPGSPAVANNSWRSEAWVVNVTISDAGSLLPVPGRSYEHTLA